MCWAVPWTEGLAPGLAKPCGWASALRMIAPPGRGRGTARVDSFPRTCSYLEEPTALALWGAVG